MAHVRVAFCGFWHAFDPTDNPLLTALRATSSVEVVPMDQAQLLIYSKHGQDHRSFVGTKVFYTAENLRPNWRHADFCIGHDYLDHPRYLRLPLFAYYAIEDVARGSFPGDDVPWADRDYCAFIYSHPGRPERRALFDALSQYRPVTSPGRFLNNTHAPELAPRDGDWRPSKINYLRRFRFVIAVENSSAPGYTTEKIYDALLAGAIPVYWGNPRIADDIDPRCFVDATGHDPARTAERVREIDEDESLALEMRAHAPGLRRSATEWLAALEEFLANCADHRVGLGARTRSIALSAYRRLAIAKAHSTHRLRARRDRSQR